MRSSARSAQVPAPRRPASPVATIDALLRRQHGLVTSEQCHRAGLSIGGLRARVRTGNWHRLSRGVYVETAAWPDGAREQLIVRCRGLLLILPPGSAISHCTAGTLWQLARVDDAPHDEIHVTVPHGAGPVRIHGCRAHTTREPIPAVQLLSLPVTDLARTVVDVARTQPVDAAVVAADSALAMRPQLEFELVDALLGCNGWPGHQRAAFVVRFADGRAESVLESLARLRWHDAGLPPPEVQATIRDRGRFVARVDFLWRAARLVVEVDGMGKYADATEIAREKQRQNGLVRAGYTVLRFTWADVVHRPAEPVATVRALLAAA